MSIQITNTRPYFSEWQVIKRSPNGTLPKVIYHGTEQGAVQKAAAAMGRMKRGRLQIVDPDGRVVDEIGIGVTVR